MWAHTKMHHIDCDPVCKTRKTRVKRKNWRDLFKKDLKKRSEQGLYLQGLRIRDGYTQEQLGELIGVSQNNISAMENGHRSIGKDIAQRLAKVFKVHYQRFL